MGISRLPCGHRPFPARRCVIALLLLALASACVPAGSLAQELELRLWLLSLRNSTLRATTAYTVPDVGPDSSRSASILAEALGDSRDAVRQYATAAIGDVGLWSPEIAGSLIELLDDESAEVQGQAVVALGKLGHHAVPVLLRRLAADEVADRNAETGFSCEITGGALAAVALGQIGPAAIDEIMAIVPRLDERRRTLAAFALSHMGTSVADLLEGYLNHADPAVRQVAALAVSQLGPNASYAAQFSPDLVPTLTDRLADPDPAVRMAAARALSVTTGGVPKGERASVVGDLVAGLEANQPPLVRRDIVRALGAIGEEAAPARESILSYVAAANDTTASAVGITALGSIGVNDSATRETLARAVRSRENVSTAARTLAMTGSDGASHLLQIALDGTETSLIRAAALEGIFEVVRDTMSDVRDSMGDAESEEDELDRTLNAVGRRLIQLLDDPSPEVRAAAAPLVGAIGGSDATGGSQAMVALAGKLSDPDASVREGVVIGFGQIGPAAVDMLLSRVQTEGALDSRATVLRALGNAAQGDARSIAVLTRALDDPSFTIRAAAMDGLSDNGSAARAAAPTLLERHPRADAMEAQAIRETLWALSPLDETAFPALRNALRSSNPAQQKLAGQLLVSVGTSAKPLENDLRRALRNVDSEAAPLIAEALIAAAPLGRENDQALKILYDEAVASLLDESEKGLRRALGCPLTILRSGPMFDPPPFPWPPPPASSSDIIPRAFLGDSSSSLGDVHTLLDHAIREADFGQIPLYTVPGGFALVTQVERIHENGAPYDGFDRWTPGKLAPRSLGEYLAQLFLGKPGRFRMIAIAITTQPNAGEGAESLTEEAARALAAGGGRALPPSIAELPFSGREALVLVYQFERLSGSASTVLTPSRPTSPIDHLELAGVWEGLDG